MAFGVGLVQIFLGVGLLASWWAVHTGRLGRNRFVGMRTKAALASDEAWRAAHAAAGWSILAAGAATLVLGVFLVLTRPDEDRTAALPNAYAIGLLIVVSLGGFVGDRAARRVGPGM